MQPETQQSISQWAEATFGPSGSDLRVWARANEEMAELLRLLTFNASPDPEKVAEECADVVIVLLRLAERRGWEVQPWASSGRFAPISLASRANEKMAALLVVLEENNSRFPAEGRWRLEEVLGALKALCLSIGQEPAAALDRKMAVNRARQWKLDGSGHGYHVKEPANAPL